MLHDGKVHNPLGAGSYIYKKNYIPSLIRYLGLPLSTNDKILQRYTAVVIHIGAQPNNSPHAGTMVVFILAFLIAREMKKYYEGLRGNEEISVEFAKFIDDIEIVVQLDLVDTCPSDKHNCERDGLKYQRSSRFTDAHRDLLRDYEEVLKTSSDFAGGIPYRTKYQENLMRMDSIPRIVEVLVKDRDRLGPELAPETGALAIRHACPYDKCGLAEKHGRKNRYTVTCSGHVVIEFYCPDHGYHSISTANSDEVAKLEFNTPVRNLVRTFAYGIQTAESQKDARNAKEAGGPAVPAQVHMRVTGSDYTGLYAEQLLWRQLLLLSPHLSTIPPPVIAYAPLIQDWAGSKLSKSLYVEDGAYEYLKAAGLGYLVSYAEMKRLGRDPKILFREVETWLKEPKKLFRPYSIEYLHSVFEAA
jgi:hypothetical protein